MEDQQCTSLRQLGQRIEVLDVHDAVAIDQTKITFTASQADNKVVAGFGTTGDLEVCDVADTVATCDWATPPVTAAADNFPVAVSSK